FITLLGGATAAWPVAARAQQLDRMRLIGVLMGFAESDPAAQSWLAAFRNALTQLGWSEGNNLRIAVRWGAADPDRIRTLAKELVDLRPDAIFNQTTPVTDALARVSRQFRSCSSMLLIRSAAASLQASRVRAGTSPASHMSTDNGRQMGGVV